MVSLSRCISNLYEERQEKPKPEDAGKDQMDCFRKQG